MEELINPAIVANNLRSARVRAGLTQEEAAERLGVYRQTVVRYEANPASINLKKFLQLAELYGCSVSYFFGK